MGVVTSGNRVVRGKVADNEWIGYWKQW
jgi:hypothetical protein